MSLGPGHFQEGLFPPDVRIECVGLATKWQVTIVFCTHHCSYYKLRVIWAYLTVVTLHWCPAPIPLPPIPPNDLCDVVLWTRCFLKVEYNAAIFAQLRTNLWCFLHSVIKPERSCFCFFFVVVFFWTILDCFRRPKMSRCRTTTCEVDLFVQVTHSLPLSLPSPIFLCELRKKVVF